MGSMPKEGQPITLNGAFHVNTQIMKFVVASAAETELGALFRNCQDGIMFWTTLHNLGHPQPKLPVHCDNATADGIASNTVKRQQARAMEMRIMWVGDKISQQMTSQYGTQDKKTLQTIKASIMSGHTMLT